MADLDDVTLERYSRHILLPEIDEAGQQKLPGACVACVGLGGLANAALPLLAGAGVGRISLIDADRVSLSNLPRQTLYDEESVGSPKVWAAAERLQAHNRAVTFNPVNQRLTHGNAESLLADADLIIDAVDNFPARYALNDAALNLGLPFVSASLMRFGGQISFFTPHFKDEDGKTLPCYRCLYPEPPPDDLLPRCDTLGVFAPAASLFGVMLAAEALKYLLGLEGLLKRRLLMLELDDWQCRQIQYDHNPQCRAGS